MPGYFDDGAIHLELGEHVFATPAGRRCNLALGPRDAPSRVLDSGGGLVDVAVTGQRLRANLGDAERYIYETFRLLAASGPGTLGIEDANGDRATAGQSVCTGAVGEVRAFRFAGMRLEFLTAEKQAEPAWGSIPAAPGAYAGTDTLQDYAVGGVQIGTHPVGMRIEMTRSYHMREIPRARGARSRGPARGAQIRFIVSSHAMATDQHLAEYLANLTRQIGPRRADLEANGNVYPGVLLESVRPVHTDERHTRFEAELVMELTLSTLTTTPAPYPTTTTIAPETTTPEPTTTTTTVPTTTTTLAATAPNEGDLDSGALQTGGASQNEGNLDSGALQT